MLHCSPLLWISTSQTSGWALNRCNTCSSGCLVQPDHTVCCLDLDVCSDGEFKWHLGVNMLLIMTANRLNWLNSACGCFQSRAFSLHLSMSEKVKKLTFLGGCMGVALCLPAHLPWGLQIKCGSVEGWVFLNAQLWSVLSLWKHQQSLGVFTLLALSL